MKNDPNKILRFTPKERANHWLSAITFVLAALSGLSFFQPLYFPLSQLFGGGTWTRILHPFIGIVMFISFCVMYLNYRELNVLTPTDKEWLRRVRDMVSGDDRNMPEAGKFNAGQKVLFWMFAGCMALLLLSGIVIWRAYFSSLFPIGLIRFASVIHAAAGAVMVGLVLFHIYAAIWMKESIDAMLYGWVRRPWARQHHPAWYKEMAGGRK